MSTDCNRVSDLVAIEWFRKTAFNHWLCGGFRASTNHEIIYFRIRGSRNQLVHILIMRDHKCYVEMIFDKKSIQNRDVI